MIGGITSNLYGSRYFKRGTGDCVIYNLLKDSRLSGDALYALTVSFILDDNNSYEAVDEQGASIYRDTFKEVYLAYVNEMAESTEVDVEEYQIPFIEIDEDDSLSPSDSQNHQMEFDLMSISGAMMAGRHFDCNKSEIDVAIEAQRIVEGITHKKEYINYGINMAFLYSVLLNMPKEKDKKTAMQNKKMVIESFMDNLFDDPKDYAFIHFTGVEPNNLKMAVNAVFASILEAKDFEDAMKKASSCHYYAAFLSFTVGALAELVFSVNKDLSDNAYTSLEGSQTIYDALSEYQKNNPPFIGKKRNIIKRTF